MEKQLHPEWSYGAVLYEMNVRQLTAEGTLRAAAARLAFLRDLGIDAVWLMPVYPIGRTNRKGSLGSYYSISDYCAVNPEMGDMADFDAFVEEAHRLFSGCCSAVHNPWQAGTDRIDGIVSSVRCSVEADAAAFESPEFGNGTFREGPCKLRISESAA